MSGGIGKFGSSVITSAELYGKKVAYPLVVLYNFRRH